MLRVAARMTALLLLLSAGTSSASVVGAATRQRVREHGRARVLVALKAPGSTGRTVTNEARRAAAVAVRQRVLAALPAGTAAAIREYATIPGFAAEISLEALERLERHADVLRVDLDGQGEGALAESVPQIRADRVHARGLGGAGVTIAVLDSGIDATHQDLQDALIREECFCAGGCCPNGTSRQSGPGSAASASVHGVHVAGIAVSRGRVSPVGVAPAARLVAVRVLDDRNRGSLSDWIAALDWIADKRPDVRLVNMSLVSDKVYQGTCDQADAGTLLFSQVINELYAFPHAALVFVSSGNRGYTDATTAPACIDRALAVAAVDGADRIAAFSDRSAALDLLAPGVNVLSDAPGGGVATLSGTSMAAPHAASAAALLLSALPTATAEVLEAALRDTGVRVADPAPSGSGLTFPRVDALGALNAVNAANPLVRGGGSRATDCLLEWSFAPPDIVRDGPTATAVCVDNDPACDADTVDGQCTFLIQLCFKTIDPRLTACRVDESLFWYGLSWPRLDAPPGDPARQNARSLIDALPAFPVGDSVCGVRFPYRVPRALDGDGRGFDEIRLAVRTATRNDYDRVRLICEPPRPEG